MVPEDRGVVLSIEHQLQDLISLHVCVEIFEVISSLFGSCQDILLSTTQLKNNFNLLLFIYLFVYLFIYLFTNFYPGWSLQY